MDGNKKANSLVSDFEDYDSDDFVSLPWFSTETTFDRNPLELDYSYGYDCSECSNLCVVDRDTLLWYTGNIIHVFNVVSKKLSFRRSALGQDISCITVNRNATCEFAVAENGDSIREGFSSPMVIVYKWPGFAVRSVLRGGAARNFRSLDFSCDGTKLVTQAGLPDVTLTIWDVDKRFIIYTFENPNVLVNKAIFSPFDPNAFVTCGQGHVKFWRLIKTFTGLKSEGLPGRFNKIENDDVCALFFLSDGRVVTNINKGNLAIWRPNALLELEFSMKNGEACHSDLVTFIKIYFKDNHVVTAGLDGYIRVWNYSYITSFYNEEQPESVHIVIEPSYERAIQDTAGNSALPILLVPKDSESEPYLFYLQDRNGGIWMLDLALKKNPKPWEMLYDCHSGPVLGLSASPAEYYFVAVGKGGKVILYNQLHKKLVVTRRFNEDGTSVLWLPMNVYPRGRGIAVGFRCGVLRILSVVGLGQALGKQTLRVVQAFRPHSSAVTSIVVHKDGDVLLTGSADRSIFVHKFLKDGPNVVLKPLGMVRMPGPVCHLTWNPFKADLMIVMVTCSNGQSAEVSIASEILEAADRQIAEIRETYVLVMPVVTTLVQCSTTEPVAIFSYYMTENVIWIEGNSHGLYKIGGDQICELHIPGQQTVQCLIDVGASENYVYQILGLCGGQIRVVKKRVDDIENYSDYWEIVMHKTENSSITALCVSPDKRFLYSCGTDSAIFTYQIQELAEGTSLPAVGKFPICLDEEQEVEEIENIPSLSLEDEKIARSQDEIQQRHLIRVREYKTELKHLISSYHELIKINKSLPRKLRLPKSFLRLETEEERKREKIGMAQREDIAQAPAKEISAALSEKLHRVQAGFVNLIQTPRICLFAIKSPYCLKSFPERRLFSADPKAEMFTNGKVRVEEWEKSVMERISADGAADETSDFERLLVKILKKLQRERKKDFYLDQPVDEESFQPKDGRLEDPDDGDQIPDLITAAGEFLGAYGKFTMAEHQIFQRIDRNRLRRQKCRKEMEQLEKIEVDSKRETKETRLFEKLKATSTNKEKLPTLTEKLYDLLNTREQIYFTKESFNKRLKELRNEKLRLINYFYWAQQEMDYISNDLKSWGLEKSLNLKIPIRLELAFELEFPETMAFEPDICPEPIAERFEMYADQLNEIQNVAPIEILKMQNVRRWPLFLLLKKRQENFMSAIAALYQTLKRLVKNFDSNFRPLLLDRTRCSLEVNELKIEFYSILEEVDILHRYKIAQRSINGYKSEIIKVKHVQILKENINKKKMNGWNEQMKECHRTIDDLNAKFFETIRDEYDQSPYLKELYFNACASTENSKLVDCDEELLQQTMKLCEQRRVEENRLLEIRQEQELIQNEQVVTQGKIKITDALLALFFATTSHNQIKLRDELGDVRYLVKLHPSQVQIFGVDDPLNNLPPMEDCRLIEHEDYLKRVHALDDMASVLKEITVLVEKTRRSTNSLNKELEMLAQHNSSVEAEIQKLLREKYGTETDVNDLQTYVLMNMIKKVVKRSADNLKKHKIVDRKQLDSASVEKCKFEAYKTKRERVKTLHTLYTIQAEKNRIAINRLTHQKRTGPRKINLVEEKARLLEELKKVDSEERKLRKLIDENKI
ncbi:Hypothetical protein NTJ_01061 [Nesidiocoris tenuis]|uniref:Cilia- and flagella-associated protein 44 n=1 Tax=Nesidiocoris tenuis TaxID=355587 RepID=A0ABN7A7J0_9HEMI|nr:Hypothetical protein NTJ_01061 [Nesidiocoris tenuis]